jgi:hypothetical protein
MKIMSRILMLSAVAVALTACGALASYPVPSGGTETLTPNWPTHFSITWSTEPSPPGGTRVDGYVVSRLGTHADSLRLLVQALDASGTAVGQRMVAVQGGVGGFGRAYFDARGLPRADHYRVSVWDYSLIQAP